MKCWYKTEKKKEERQQQQAAPPPCPSPKGRGVECEIPLWIWSEWVGGQNGVKGPYTLFTCYPVSLCKQLVYSSNLFTCQLTLLFCLFHKQLVYSSTRPLVHLPCYPVFDTSNLFTRSLVYSSTNCLYLLNIKVNISIISIWVVWSIGVIRPILKKEYEERCKWLFVNELWEGECKAFDHCKTVIA